MSSPKSSAIVNLADRLLDRWLPPTLAGTPAARRARNILALGLVTAILLVFGALVTLIGWAIGIEETPGFLFTNLAFLAVLPIEIALVRWGRLNAAALLLLLASLVYIGLYSNPLPRYGVEGGILLIYVVFTSSYVFVPEASFGAAIVSSVLLIAAARIEPSMAPTVALIVPVYFACALTAWLVARIMQNSIAELDRHRDHLEELVTERTAALEQARQEAERNSQLKSDMVSIVAHDVRMPLTAIVGFAEMLGEEAPSSEPIQEAKDNILKSTRTILDMSNNLLDLSKIEAGVEMEAVALDYGQLTREVVAECCVVAERKGIKLSSEIAPTPTLHGDKRRLRQVVANLMDNAIKYTPAGGQIDLAVEVKDGMIVTTVADTGIGMSESEAEWAFHRYYQARPEKGVPGVGLGLAIVRAIVEAHDGTIALETELYKGSTFIVRLPVEK